MIPKLGSMTLNWAGYIAKIYCMRVNRESSILAEEIIGSMGLLMKFFLGNGADEEGSACR